jgi:outer membrane lipoprotein SlyB
MRRVGYAQAMILSLGLSGCAVAPPTGPNVVALPGKDKSFEAFQADDAACRQYASAQIGNISPADAANQSAVGSTVLGTVAGAAAGAVIGAAAGNPAAGAAIGAGSGLVIGGATGLSAAQASDATLQWRYDLGYVQCMSAKGENVQLPIAGYPAYPYGPYDPYYLPYYGGARLGIGFGFHSHHSHHSHH